MTVDLSWYPGVVPFVETELSEPRFVSDHFQAQNLFIFTDDVELLQSKRDAVMLLKTNTVRLFFNLRFLAGCDLEKRPALGLQTECSSGSGRNLADWVCLSKELVAICEGANTEVSITSL